VGTLRHVIALLFVGGRNWRVSIVGSQANDRWEMKIVGPNAFERSYTLEGTAGEHSAESGGPLANPIRQSRTFVFPQTSNSRPEL
jgi:hypothetical protein